MYIFCLVLRWSSVCTDDLFVDSSLHHINNGQITSRGIYFADPICAMKKLHILVLREAAKKFLH